jgi:hypothetical protein
MSTSFGAGEVVDLSWIDYQLLSIERDIAEPKNDFDLSQLYEYEGIVKLKPPAIDLRDFATAFDIVERRKKFAKFGAATGLTVGNLYNSKKFDCFVGVGEGGGAPIKHTVELAFRAVGKFANNGDSGSLVYVYEDDNLETIVGLVFAVTSIAPYLTFVTPIQSIMSHFNKRASNLTITFPTQ